VFREGFSLVCAGRRLTSDSAVVWIEPGDVNEPNDITAGYLVRAYLSGHVSAKGGAYPQVLDIKIRKRLI